MPDSRITESHDGRNGWEPISKFPNQERTMFDLWCISGNEGVSAWYTGCPIGRMVTNRHWSKDYGWFGNQSNDGIPQGDQPDLKPVAFRLSAPSCPVEIIELETGWELQELEEGQPS